MLYPGRVSVVLPVYNGEAYIAQAIESVLAQSYADVELIVVNDGSTDRTAQILEDYGERLQAVSISNQRLSVARNVGILESSGEFIALLDDDDVWHPQKLSIQVDLMRQNPGWMVVSNRRVKFQADNEIVFSEVGKPDRTQLLTPYDILHRNPVHCSSALIRKEALSRSGLFVPKLGGAAEDTEMWARIARHGKVALIAPHLTLMRDHRSNTTKTYEYRRKCVSSLAFMRHAWADDRRARRIVSTNLRGNMVAVAYEASDRGDYRLASKYFLQAFAMSPRNIKWLLKGLLYGMRLKLLTRPLSRETRESI